MYEIIDILLKYEEENPSEWERTRDSMYWEWYFHNYYCNNGVEIERTKDVDLDNNDEKTYKW